MATNVTAVQESDAGGGDIGNLGKCLFSFSRLNTAEKLSISERHERK